LLTAPAPAPVPAPAVDNAPQTTPTKEDKIIYIWGICSAMLSAMLHTYFFFSIPDSDTSKEIPSDPSNSDTSSFSINPSK
jgi:hypothetical protein